MLDPVTSLGLAGNIFSFLGYAGKLALKTRDIYSAYESTQKHKHWRGSAGPRRLLQEQLQGFVSVSGAAARSPNSSSSPVPTTTSSSSPTAQIHSANLDSTIKGLLAHDRTLDYVAKNYPQANDALKDIAAQCRDLAEEMLERLERIRESPKGRLWPSLKLALKDLWSEDELRELGEEITIHQNHLQGLLIMSLKEDIHFLGIRQADQFDASRTAMRDALQDLMQENSLFSQASPTQPSQILSGLSTAALEQIIEANNKIRSDVTLAINQALDSRGFTSLDLGELHQRQVISSAAEQLSSDLLREERLLLEGLEFSSMNSRRDRISKITTSFKWIFEDPQPEDLPWNNFASWLTSDDTLYWITGKPGSGKSTLMKYLLGHQRTKELLYAWAQPDPLVIGSFFFWNTGSAMQKSKEGMLRSLMHQILSKHRELIPIMLNNLRSTGHELSSSGWRTFEELRRAFECIVRQKLVPFKLFLFIDGLDEFDGEHSDVAGFVKSVVNEINTEICTSSHPLRPLLRYASRARPDRACAAVRAPRQSGFICS